MNATTGWATLIGGIAAYEYTCIRTGNPDALLSRGLDRARARHPMLNIACQGAVVATAAHLLRVVPPKYDIFAVLRIT